MMREDANEDGGLRHQGGGGGWGGVSTGHRAVHRRWRIWREGDGLALAASPLLHPPPSSGWHWLAWGRRRRHRPGGGSSLVMQMNNDGHLQ